MNQVYAKNSQPFYEVLKNEPNNLDIAQARADGLKSQFIMDMHTHFLREGTPITAFVAQREAVGKAGWNPTLVGKPQTIEDLMFPNYVKEIFLDSDTKDGGRRACADDRAAHPADQRAFGGPGADPGQPHDREDQGTKGAAQPSPC